MAIEETKEPGLIPTVIDGLAGWSNEGVRDWTSLKRRLPGNALRAIGALTEMIPLVGPMAGAGWRGLGDAVDYGFDNEAPAGNPDYNPNRRNYDGLTGTAISVIPLGGGLAAKGLGKVGNLFGRAAEKPVKKLTERSGLGSLIIGRPGPFSPRPRSVTVGGENYYANPLGTALRDNAGQITDPKLLKLEKKPNYYQTHSVGELPTEYRIPLSKEGLQVAKDNAYAVQKKGKMQVTRKLKPNDEVLDFTEGKFTPKPENITDAEYAEFVAKPPKVSKSRDIVKSDKAFEGDVGGIPLGKKSKPRKAKVNDLDEITENVDAYEYSRIGTAKRMPNAEAPNRQEKIWQWKDWEGKEIPDATVHHELEQYAKHAPIGGVQGLAYDNRGFLGLTGAGSKFLNTFPQRKIITSKALNVGEPAVKTEPSLEKRMEDEGFTPGQKRYSAPIDYTGKSTKEKQIVRPKQSKKDKEAAERADLLRRARTKRGN